MGGTSGELPDASQYSRDREMNFAEALGVAGFVVTLLLAMRGSGKACLDTQTTYWACLLGAVGALLGGRIVVVATGGELPELSGFLSELLSEDKSAVGALAGAASLAVPFALARGRSIFRYGDVAAPAIAAGYAVSRLGCFVHGCCYGTLNTVPWAVTFQPGTVAYADHFAAGWIAAGAPRSLPVHPTQLYSAVLALAMFTALTRVRDRPAGTRLAVALIAYGLGRFVIEFFRADAHPLLGGLDFEQLACLVMAIGGLSTWRLIMPSVDLALQRTRSA
jgi:phosphatidylglycerol:prolipoprotein diacylglycerol transferase